MQAAFINILTKIITDSPMHIILSCVAFRQRINRGVWSNFIHLAKETTVVFDTIDFISSTLLENSTLRFVKKMYFYSF